MRTIAHLSDLHFGRIEPAICAALAAEVHAARPDIVVVSGDMTQRARRHEFTQARAFLDTLPSPRIVVPGNHDIPLYNLFMRTFAPLARYRRSITADTEPFYTDPEIAIAGINTARSLTFKGGRINGDQLAWVERAFAGQPDETTRIIVTHHPFEGANIRDDEGVVGRARLAMEVFSRSRIDMILSGHLHLNRIGSSAVRYDIEGYAALLIQAGTATSSRRREQANSFNLIRVQRPDIELECRAWDPQAAAFITSARTRFRFGPAGWAPAEAAPMPTLVQSADDVVAAAGVSGHG